MDPLEQVVWERLGSKILKFDVWKWFHECKLGFTFQSMQYKETCRRLDKMYVMHDDSLLPEMLNMSIVQELVTSNNFPICFEYNKHVVDIYKTLLDRVPLRFDSSSYFIPYSMPICNKISACFQNMLIQKDDIGYNITKH